MRSKKTIIGVAIAAVILGTVAVTIANKNVENKINAMIDDYNTQKIGYHVATDVSVNILSGTLTLDNITAKAADDKVIVTGNALISGLRFYDDKNLFSNHIKMTTENLVYEQDGFNYPSKNEMDLKNDEKSGELKIGLTAHFEEKNDSTAYMNQKADFLIANTGNLYGDITKALSIKLMNEPADITPYTTNVMSKLNNSIVKSLNFSIENSKIFQKSTLDEMKAVYPSASEAELKELAHQKMMNQNDLLPLEIQKPFQNFFNNPKHKITIDVTSKANASVKDIYLSIMTSPDVESVLLSNYEIKVKE